MRVVEGSPFWQSNANIENPVLNSLVDDVVEVYAKIGNLTLVSASEELGHYLREFVTWERNTVWKEMVGRERKKTALGISRVAEAVVPRKRFRLPFIGFVTLQPRAIMLIFSVLVFVIVINLKFFKDSSKDNCLALFVLASSFWALEVLPLFVTAILIPFLAVALQILRGKDGQTLKTTDAAKEITGHMFSPVIMLLLGGFTIAAALSKFHIAKGLATFILSKAGTKSNSVLLVIMFVATFASMWLSNVAAPVLCFSVIEVNYLSLHSHFSLFCELWNQITN
jgi:phosphate transporter